MLVAGFVAGPVTGWLDPDALFGESLFSFVSLAVAIILFEGGLSLHIDELTKIGRVFRNLVFLGGPITWVLAGVFAYTILGFEAQLAALLGAILIVTGPTVIIPLLRQIRPSGRAAAVVRWEGIVNDPVGAILAVLVFDFIVASAVDAGWGAAASGAGRALLAGSLLGLAGAGLMVLLLRQYLIPDFLRSPVTLALVLGVFVASDSIMKESGLLAVTVMGSALASQPFVKVRHIVHFKENLRVLLISVLFVVLAARLPLNDPAYTDPRSLLFLGALIFVVRPVAVMVSTLGSDLPMRERIFLMVMAPRGIVAAAVASVFAIELIELAHPGADRLAPVMFLVIIGTVAIYGLASGPVARLLGLAVAKPQGILFVGAAPWVRAVASTLHQRDVQVLLVDSNWNNVAEARQAGLPAHFANILDEDVPDELEMDGIGRCVLATPNDRVNALAADHLRDVFDQSNIYQVAPSDQQRRGRLTGVPAYLQVRMLPKEATWENLAKALGRGAVVKQTNLTKEFTFQDFVEHYQAQAIPLFSFDVAGRVHVLDERRKPDPGGVIISLAPAEDAANVKA